MKKILALTLTLVMGVTMLTACGNDSSSDSSESVTDVSTSEPSTDVASDESSVADDDEQVVLVADPTDFTIASLKGPTTMGMIKLVSDADNGLTKHNYDVSIYGTADEITTGIVKGEIDVANVPCNLASVLYNKTEGEIYITAINTLGVLYVVENGTTVNSVEDLKGKTIYSTGKNTTPEYALNYILRSNGIDPEKDVTIEFKSEATEVAAMLSEDTDAIAVLPQPYVTVVMNNNENVRIALDLTEEWDNVQGETPSSLVTGVVIARKEFVDENPIAFSEFLSEYEASTEWVNANIDEASELIGSYEIVGAPVAKKAIPYCNITFIDSTNGMKSLVEGYLSVLFDQNPASVGGTMPDDAFYYERLQLE